VNTRQQVARLGAGLGGRIVLLDLEPERPQVCRQRIGDRAFVP
jgi:hypothetical protein